MQPWQKTLQKIGYPTTAVVIDFEAYFDHEYSLTAMTTPEYITDDRFELTGVGIGEMAGKEFNIFFVVDAAVGLVEDRMVNWLQCKYGANYRNVTVVMHNASFDAMVLQRKFGIECPYIIDTKDLAKHLEPRASAKLKDVAPRYNLESKGDTSQFLGLRFDDMTVEHIADLSEYTRQDIKLEGELLQIMLPLINNPEHEIKLMNYTRKLILNSPIEFNFDLAKELVTGMGIELATKIDATGHTQEELSGNLSFVAILQDALPDDEQVPTKAHKRPGKKMTELLGRPGIGPAFSKDDKGMKDLLVHSDEHVRSLVEARQSVKSWPTHIQRVERMYRCSAANGGTLPIATAYYGAHTARWSGTWGYNVLNMGSRSHPLINRVRNLLRAPRGYRFVLKDWKQVEARFLAWWSGQDDLVEDFANGGDIYSLFASDLFGCRVRNVEDYDPPAIKAFFAPKRHMGKETILGGGYGMGPSKFFTRMQTNDVLREMIINGVYSLKTAKDAIYGYRKKYSKIPKLWDEVEKGFKHVLNVPRDTTYELPKGFSVSSHGTTVTMNFPTGRTMVYHDCKIKHTQKGSSIGWKYGYLWGGTLVENAVQSACRDIMTNSWVQCEEAGLNICFQLYDELVAMTPLPKVKMIEEQMEAIMTTVPDWAEGLPLATDTKILEYYTK